MVLICALPIRKISDSLKDLVYKNYGLFSSGDRKKRTCMHNLNQYSLILSNFLSIGAVCNSMLQHAGHDQILTAKTVRP